MILGSGLPVEVSVVIPVLNEAENLPDCLRAVFAQELSGGFEVIVADGMSTDGSGDIARGLGAVVVENRAKSAAAGRNAGIAVARGAVIAFTDGDCVPERGWLAALEGAFADPLIDGVAGRVVPARPRSECERFWNHLAWEVIMPFGGEGRLITERSLGSSLITASCAYRASSLRSLGGFDEWFGNNAEDVDLTWRALAAGMRLSYEPSARVAARGPVTAREMRAKAFRNGVSSSKLQKRYGGRVNCDPTLYSQLLGALGKGDLLMADELVCHLFGKYCGSVRHGVVNV